MIRERTLALKYNLRVEKMSECILELIIASTLHEEFRRDLIGKDKGYAIADLLKGHKFEVMMADRDQLQ